MEIRFKFFKPRRGDILKCRSYGALTYKKIKSSTNISALRAFKTVETNNCANGLNKFIHFPDKFKMRLDLCKKFSSFIKRPGFNALFTIVSANLI